MKKNYFKLTALFAAFVVGSFLSAARCAAAPQPFNLVSPVDTATICEERPTFVWDASQDDQGIDSYSFQIWTQATNSARPNELFELTFLPTHTATTQQTQDELTYNLTYNSTTDQYRLQLYADFDLNPNLTYHWQVTAFDADGNSRIAQREFSYRRDCMAINCADYTATPQLIQPQSTLFTNQPAIVFTFDPQNRNQSIQNFSFDLSVDGQDVINDLRAHDQSTEHYTLYYEPSNHQFSLLLHQPLWSTTPTSLSTAATTSSSLQSTTNGEHTLQIQANYRACQTTTQRQFQYQPLPSNSVGSSSNSTSNSQIQCQTNLPRPTLISPQNNVPLNQPPSKYSWSVCLPVDCVPTAEFSLNGHRLTDLSPGDHQGIYTVEVETQDNAAHCSGGTQTSYHLTVHRYSADLPLINSGQNIWGAKMGGSFFTSQFPLHTDTLLVGMIDGEDGSFMSTAKFCQLNPAHSDCPPQLEIKSFLLISASLFLIVFIIFIITLIRLFRAQPCSNFNLQLVDQFTSLPQAQLALEITPLDSIHHPSSAMTQIYFTDDHGQLHLYLEPGNYKLSFPGHAFYFIHHDQAYTSIQYQVKPRQSHLSTLKIKSHV